MIKASDSVFTYTKSNATMKNNKLLTRKLGKIKSLNYK